MHQSLARFTLATVLAILVIASASALAPAIAPAPTPALAKAPSRCTQAWRQSIVNTINQLEVRVAALEAKPSQPSPPPPPSPPATQPASQPASPTTAPASTAPPAHTPAVPSPKITWKGADGVTEHELIIEPPVEPRAITIPSSRGLDLSNLSDVKIANITMGKLPAECNAIHVGNEQTSLRVSIANVSGDASNYGIYLGGVYHWRFTDVSISQQADSPEHALRMTGNHVLFERVTLDSTNAGKRTVWCYGDDIAFIDCTLRGGAVWIGATPDAFPGSEQMTAHRILVRGGHIDQTRPDMPAAIAILPGSDDVVFEKVAITGPAGHRAADIDSRRMGSVLFRNCTWNGRPLKRDDLGDDSGRAKVEP